MIHLLRKELISFWSNSFSLVALGVLIILSFLFLWIFPDSSYLTYGLATFDLYFQYVSYLLLFVVPAFAVGLMSHEYVYGTEILLRSLGVNGIKVVGTKFLAALLVLILIMTLLSIHLYVIGDLAVENMDSTRQIFIGHLGLIIIGACYASLSIMVASFTEQTTSSLLVSIIVCFLFYSGFNILSGIPIFEGNIDYLLDRFSLTYHTGQLSSGILRMSTLLYCPLLILWSLWVASSNVNEKYV